MKLISSTLLALTLLSTIVSAEPIKEHTPAPNFTSETVAGKTIRLSDFKGKVVLLDFGAVECPPCRLEMPFLEAWSKKYKSQGLVVLGLMEMNPKRNQVREMLKKRHISFPVAIDVKEKIGGRYGLIAHPTTVLIDQSGNVAKLETGFVLGDEKEMEIALLALLHRSSKMGVK